METFNNQDDIPRLIIQIYEDKHIYAEITISHLCKHSIKINLTN